MNIRPVSSKHDTDALLDQSKLKCALKVNFWIRTLNWKLTQLTQLLVNTDIKTSTTLGNVKEIQQLSVKKDFLIYSVLWPFLNHFQAETTCPVIHSHLCSASFLQPVRSPERERRQGGHKIAKKKPSLTPPGGLTCPCTTWINSDTVLVTDRASNTR